MFMKALEEAKTLQSL